MRKIKHYTGIVIKKETRLHSRFVSRIMVDLLIFISRISRRLFCPSPYETFCCFFCLSPLESSAVLSVCLLWRSPSAFSVCLLWRSPSAFSVCLPTRPPSAFLKPYPLFLQPHPLCRRFLLSLPAQTNSLLQFPQQFPSDDFPH